MARIVVITHEFDRFSDKRGLFRKTSRYMFPGAVDELQSRGHSCTVSVGLSHKAGGDVALLHVDATVTPPDYLEYAKAFPICLNLSAADISKRKISNAAVKLGDGWDGPVIVKSNLNHGGSPESHLNRTARTAGQPEPFPNARRMKEYKVYEHSSLVPAETFEDPGLFVERFLPEPEKDGFAMRHWIFCGTEELCGRFISSSRMVKGSGIFRAEPAEAPEDLRRKREELGFDYGKFDFAVHDGKTYLFDANKTPGAVPRGVDGITPTTLANGFEGLIRAAC